MCPNVLTAIKSIAEFRNNDLSNYFETAPIRINQVGQKLEYYVMDAISGSFKKEKTEETVVDRSDIFSHIGTQNNPPDIIIAHGDAFEIKKIQALKATLALNNSPPKNKLYRNDPRITKKCRNTDGGNWESKDIFYVIGCSPKTNKGKLKYLFFVHGECYAAKKDFYESKAVPLKNHIDSFFRQQSWVAKQTAELGRINGIDPLSITNFRIRGMWEVENPLNVFSSCYSIDERKEFSLVAIMTKEKYESFPIADKLALKMDTQVKSQTIKVRNPNNTDDMMDAQLITSEW